ncbi:MAG: BON domain-containing protein [Burkholderiales bacterium]|nr:BON domain-containing protein [Burkholderiales bacterium]
MTRSVILATSISLIALSLGLAGCGQHEEGVPSASNTGAQTSSSSDTGNSTTANADTSSSSNTQTLARADSPSVPAGASAATPSLMDTALIAKVKSAIAADPSAAKLQLQVKSDGGFITLTGKADSQAQADSLTNLVQAVPGVKSVMNNVQVQSKGA